MPIRVKCQVDWFNLIKQNISIKNNIEFFLYNNLGKNKIAKYIGTGIGKTYNSAYLAIYTLLYTNNKIVIATTKNDNVEDLLYEIIKILKNNIKLDNKSELIPYLSKEAKKSMGLILLKNIGIHKMVSYNQIEKSEFEKARVIITNHSYFYQKGDSPDYLKNMKNLKEVLNEDDIIIIDEADEYENRSYLEISLNNYFKTSKTQLGDIEKYTSNCFCSHDEKYYRENIDECRFVLPRENTKVRYSNEGDFKMPTYVLDKDSEYDLLGIIDKFYTLNNEIHDTGRRIGFSFESKNGKYKLLRVYKSELLELKNDVNHINIETDDILRNIQNSQAAAIMEQFITILNIETDEILFTFNNRYQFIDWCKNNLTNKQYDTLIKQLIKETSDLFKKHLKIRRKSILDSINCKKYFLTATPYILEDLGYTIEAGINSKKNNSIKQIDIFFIERKQAIDNLVTNIGTNGMLDYKDINCLAFCSEKRNVEKLIIGQKKYLYKDKKYLGIKVKSSVNDGTNDIKSLPICLGASENFEFVKDFSTISYLNGTETTGKNYNQANLCIINTKPEINARGRIILTKNKQKFIDIELTSFRNVIQAGGRIERGNEFEYKSIILIGEYEDIVNKYINEKSGNGIKYNYVDKIKFNEHHLKAKISKILKTININIYNDFERIQNNYNKDNRIKYDKDKIIEYFLYLRKNNVNLRESKKQTIEKFKIKKRLLDKYLKQ